MRTHILTLQVTQMPDRIDFNYNYQEGTTIYKNITNLQVYANELVKKVFSVFGSTMGEPISLLSKLPKFSICAISVIRLHSSVSLSFSNEINLIISHDDYSDGEMSQSEIFMKEAYEKEQMEQSI